jgi:hypothetical protein
MNDPAGPDTRPPLPPDVNELLTSGAVVACYYRHPRERPIRPHCQELATVVYGSIALCASCDRARSAVGKGTVPRHLPDPAALVAVRPARAALDAADTALADTVTEARAAGHPWSAIAAALGVSRQAAQQRFTRTRPPTSQP